MTGCGCLCLQLMGQPGAPEVKAGLEYLKDVQCQWNSGAADKDGKGGGKNEIYGWYYITQAKFQRGGPEWESWNKMFSRQIVLGQEKDGHWEHGDHAPGPVYATAFCTLMLEVYYRYLPSYQKVEEAPPPATPAASEEVAVKVI